MKIVTKSVEIAGRTLTLEVGRFASLATSSVLAKYGETTVQVAVVTGQEDTKLDYFPLSVDFQERLYAGGRIKGSRWVKREGRPTDAEVLAGRLIDRSIRPLFPKNYKRDVQIAVMVLSVDMENDADILGVVATSAALAISPIPWDGPVAAVRLGLEDGKVVINPANGNRPGADMDLVITSTETLIPMIEAGANQVGEETINEALGMGFEENKKIIKLINELAGEAGNEKFSLPEPVENADLLQQVRKAAKSEIDKFLADYKKGQLGEIKSAISDTFPEEVRNQVKGIVEQLVHQQIRENLLSKKQRIDGRGLDKIREIEIEAGIIPRVHGSASFKRGETQALTVTTLGSPSLSQSLESAEGEETKRYMHHYNFPPFSTGETGRMSFTSRREIGHGALAERALLPVIPADTVFPYAIRVVSEIMSSNGSTSMASVCGSTLSLMDAGVPIIAPVAGISVGLVTEEGYPKKDKYLLLTDIIGLEDHHTDMDFKVAGTRSGVTAIQLDVKVPGISLDICKEALTQAKIARENILDMIAKALPEPRKQLSMYAPKIASVSIPVDRIGELIGPGGKVIRKLMADTETVIDVNDEGLVFVTGTDQAKVDEAIVWIESLFREVKAGEEYEGTVVRMQPFGAFVNILPGKDGLVHVSQMAAGFVGDPNEVVKEGDKVKVRVMEIDDLGRVNLTMLTPEEQAAKRENGGGQDRGPRPQRDFRGGGFRPRGRDDRRGGRR